MSTVNRWIGVIVIAGALHAQAADTWQHVNKENQPLLPGNDIQFIKAGSEKGQVWIGTLSGAAEIKDGVLRPMAATKDMKVWDITKRPEGGFWVGHDTGVTLVDGDRTVQALKGNTVASIKMVGARLWAIAKNEAQDVNTLVQAEGEDWKPVEAFKDRRVLDLVEDAKGTFWLVLDGDGVMEILPKEDPAKARQHLPRLNVTSVLTDSHGRTWCGMMGGGLMVREDDKWRSQLTDERSAVLSLAEDGEGKVWAATSGNGLWVFDGKDWKGMLQEEGAVNLLQVSSDKRIWVSTGKNGGLRYWDGKEWKESLESNSAIRCLTELPDAVFLAGGVLDGVHIFGKYDIKGE